MPDLKIASTIREKRLALGLSQEALAKQVGATQATIDKIENGRSQRSRFLPAVLSALDLPLETLLGDLPVPPANATIGQPTPLGATGARMPVYGQAIGGEDGRFMFNGHKIADVLTPPGLLGVPDAYAVLIAGESMLPRYRAGETAYIHPHLPVRRGDYVVIQVRSDDAQVPSAYVKQFVSMDDRRIRLFQHNPEKEMTFPRKDVLSIHRIVMAGD